MSLPRNVRLPRLTAEEKIRAQQAQADRLAAMTPEQQQERDDRLARMDALLNRRKGASR